SFSCSMRTCRCGGGRGRPTAGRSGGAGVRGRMRSLRFQRLYPIRLDEPVECSLGFFHRFEWRLVLDKSSSVIQFEFYVPSVLFVDEIGGGAIGEGHAASIAFLAVAPRSTPRRSSMASNTACFDA